MENQDSKQKPKIRNINGIVTIHIMAIGYALYMLYSIVRDYRAGGADAPALSTVIIGSILLLGGCAIVGWLTWRMYRQAKQEEKEAAPEQAEISDGADSSGSDDQ